MVSNDFLKTAQLESPPTQEIEVIPPEKQFLQFSLENNVSLLLSVLSMVEILTLPTSQVVPIFQLPAWVMGVYNWRGDILWVVDLNHLVGFTPWYQRSGYGSKHTAIVVRDSQPGLGAARHVVALVVDRIENMTVCEPEQMQSPETVDIPETIRPFLGQVWRGEDGQLRWILAGNQVLDVMPGRAAA